MPAAALPAPALHPRAVQAAQVVRPESRV